MMEDGTVVSLYITVAITVLGTPRAQELHVVMQFKSRLVPAI